VSGDTTESRALLQARMTLLTGVYSLLFSATTTVAVLSRALLPEEGVKPPPTWWAAQVAIVVILVAGWLFFRGSARPPAVVRAYDAAMPLCVGICVVVMISGIPTIFRPEIMVTLGMTHLLVARAALIPSSGRRTAIIGALAWLPVVAGTYATYRAQGHPLLPLGPTAFAIAASVWAGVAIASTTVASRVIYGLHEEARIARQLGQYTLEEKIGAGGMGVVYRARHAMLRRPTAIKLLSPDRATEADAVRFEREVQLTSQLTHPNTIAIYDYGRTADGAFYYAMELLDGADLETLVRTTGPLPPARAIHVLRQVCGALAEAHDSGLIHRDVKPANVILCGRNVTHEVAKVVDFGLVRPIEQAEGVARTVEGALTGTPLYASPEAIKTPAEIDGRSDLYGVGGLGYFLVTGAPPFDGKTIAEVCSHHLMTPPVPPSLRVGHELPRDLEAVLLACLAKDRDDRPASAAALADALDACADAGAWSEDEARAWWALHRDELRRDRAHRTLQRSVDSGLAGASTVAVIPPRLLTTSG
jgi:hypothetical protein